MSKADKHVPLPVMNMVWDRTLGLAGYTLNQGQQNALAHASPHFATVVQSVILEQNGFNSFEIAKVIQGLNKSNIREFTYRNDPLSPAAIDELCTLVGKKVPNELLKLELVSPQLKPSPAQMISKLVGEIQWCKLQTVALVDCGLGPDLAEMLAQTVSRNKNLRELDLSMNEQFGAKAAAGVLGAMAAHA